MPLQIQIEGKNYLDGVDIDKETFYEKMMNSKEFFKTSQPKLPIYFIKASQNM